MIAVNLDRATAPRPGDKGRPCLDKQNQKKKKLAFGFVLYGESLFNVVQRLLEMAASSEATYSRSSDSVISFTAVLSQR